MTSQKQTYQPNFFYPELVLFFENLDLIYQHRITILNDSTLYYFHLDPWYVGAAPVGQTTAYLGDLLTLWETSPAWFNRLPEITLLVDGHSRGRKQQRANPQGLRLVHVAGSALSGSNSALAWDESAKCLIKFTAPTVFGTLKSLRDHAVHRPPQVAEHVPQTVEALLLRLQTSQSL